MAGWSLLWGFFKIICFTLLLIYAFKRFCSEKEDGWKAYVRFGVFLVMIILITGIAFVRYVHDVLWIFFVMQFISSAIVTWFSNSSSLTIKTDKP
jgi:hypothetical protein